MTQYHVCCGITAIWAGTLNKKGNTWRNKSDVTDEACSAVAQYFLQNDKLMVFTYREKRYMLKVEEVDT
jgi:hypothetical protein